MKTKHSKSLSIFDRKHFVTIYKMRQTCLQYLTYKYYLPLVAQGSIIMRWAYVTYVVVYQSSPQQLHRVPLASNHFDFPIFHRIVPSAKKTKPFYEYDLFCNIFQRQKNTCHTMLTTQSSLFSYHKFDKFSFDIENRNVKMKTWWFLVRMFI